MEIKQHVTVNNLWVNERIKSEIEKYLETNENGNIIYETYGCSRRSSKREVHINKCLLQETKKTQVHNLTLHLKELKEQTKPKVTRRKEITNIRAAVNEIETKRQ